jgi:hypothetical protein
LRAVTATLAFALEIAMLAAFGIWGLHVGRPAAVGVALALTLIGVSAVGWGLFLAPRAARRIGFPMRWFVELALVSSSDAALWAAGYGQSAAIMGGLIVVRFGLGLATGADRAGL